MDKKSFMRVYINKCWSSLTWLIFRDTHFIGPLEIKPNDSPKRHIVQAQNNLINIFKINANIWYHVFSSNIHEYHPKYNQHQYYQNRLKNHGHIHIVQSFSYYMLKNLLKHYLNITELYLFNNILLWICIF